MKSILRNKRLMIGLAIAVVIVTIVIIIRRRNDNGENKDDINEPQGGYSEDLPLATFPLRSYSMVKEYSAEKGSYGQQIANLQKGCNDKYGTNLTVDGKWGPKTDEVFRKRLGTLLFVGGISEDQYKIFMNQLDVEE